MGESTFLPSKMVAAVGESTFLLSKMVAAVGESSFLLSKVVSAMGESTFLPSKVLSPLAESIFLHLEIVSAVSTTGYKLRTHIRFRIILYKKRLNNISRFFLGKQIISFSSFQDIESLPRNVSGQSRFLYLR